jgi:hypothetical protein
LNPKESSAPESGKVSIKDLSDLIGDITLKGYIPTDIVIHPSWTLRETFNQELVLPFDGIQRPGIW